MSNDETHDTETKDEMPEEENEFVKMTEIENILSRAFIPNDEAFVFRTQRRKLFGSVSPVYNKNFK